MGVRYWLDKPKEKKPSIEKPSKFYVGLKAYAINPQDLGLTFQEIAWNYAINESKHEFKPGYEIALALGYKVCSWCRVELEYSFKHAKTDSYVDIGRPNPDFVNLSLEDSYVAGSFPKLKIHTLFANVYADLDIAGLQKNYGITPFLGFGFGGMYIDYKTPRTKGMSSVSMQEGKFGAQFMTGANYKLTEKISVGLEYKYLTAIGGNLFAEKDSSVAGDASRNQPNSHVTNFGIHSTGASIQYYF